MSRKKAGHPRSRGGAASSGDLKLVLRALDLASRIGVRGRRSFEYVSDGEVHRTSSGLQIVHLRQQHRGVPIHQAMRSVRFDHRRRLRAVTGETFVIPARFDVRPVTAVETAVEAACRYAARDRHDPTRMAFELGGRAPRRIAEFPVPSRATILVRRPFRIPIRAELAVFMAPARPRLAWVIQLALPRAGRAYEVVVAADSSGEPAILSSRNAESHAGPVGHVFELNPDERPRQPIPFTTALADYPECGNNGNGAIPSTWIEGNRTEGNNVVAFEGNRDDPMVGSPTPSGLVFQPADPQNADQQTLNAFYWCNWLHDLFYLLGFTEAEGNFQDRNAGGASGDGDRLIVRVFPDPIEGMASMRSRRDGNHPELNLGPNAGRHTALAADVVTHEWVHGVSNRMIGGRVSHDPLEGKPQSRAMGEGYSDFFALTILNWRRRRLGVPEQRVFGAWIASDATRGLRRFPYDASLKGTYGSLGSADFSDPHDAGQIWAMTLLEMRDALVPSVESRDAADVLAWRTVVDSFHLMTPGPQAPTFLDGRQALYAAFDAIASRPGFTGDARAMRSAIEAVFAQRGMGPGANSPSAQYQGIVEDKEV